MTSTLPPLRDPKQVQALFPRTIPVGAQFGVVLVVEEGRDYQVATFRSDGTYLDGRHPRSVSFTSPEGDAKRRDFTINGLFYDPIEGKVLDFVGGRDRPRRPALCARSEIPRSASLKINCAFCARCDSPPCWTSPSKLAPGMRSAPQPRPFTTSAPNGSETNWSRFLPRLKGCADLISWMPAD